MRTRTCLEKLLTLFALLHCFTLKRKFVNTNWWYLSRKAHKKMGANIPNKIHYRKSKCFWIEREKNSLVFGEMTIYLSRSCQMPRRWGEPPTDLGKGIDSSGLDALLTSIRRILFEQRDSKVMTTLANTIDYILRKEFLILMIQLSHSLLLRSPITIPITISFSR